MLRESSQRLHMVDTLRGLAIISMIIYHTVWIMNSFGYGISTDTLYGPVCTFWERTICTSFILISGFSFSLGHHPLKNGVLTFTLGSVITLVTCIFVPQIRIIFGVLTFLGSACLIMIPINRIIYNSVSKSDKQSRLNNIILSLVFLVLFILFYNINKGYVGIGKLFSISLPQNLYNGYFMTFLGFLDPTFYSTDYFSLLPWIFLYFLGYFLNKVSSGTVFERKVLTKGFAPVSFLGRHSLIIYVIHPIVIFITVYIVSLVL